MTDYAFKIKDVVNRFPILKNGKWGYIDKSGKIVIKPEYDKAANFSGGLALVRLNQPRSIGKSSDGRLGGHTASFSDRLQPKSKPAYGFIDRDGNKATDIKFDYADSFSEDLALVRVGNAGTGMYGYIDKSGWMVIEPKFPYKDFTKDDQKFSEGLALVRIGTMRRGKYGFIDKQGHTVIDVKYKMAKPFSEGLACVKVGDWGKGKYGFINRNGHFVVKPQYDRAESHSDGLAGVWNGDTLTAFLSLLSMVPNTPEITGTWNYIDKAGASRFEIRNGWVGSFSEGFAVRELAGIRTYIDRTGCEVIKTHFDFAKPFLNDLAMVKVDGKWGYINKSGMYVWEPTN